MSNPLASAEAREFLLKRGYKSYTNPEGYEAWANPLNDTETELLEMLIEFATTTTKNKSPERILTEISYPFGRPTDAAIAECTGQLSEARQAAERIVVEFAKMRRNYLGANAKMMPEAEATDKLIGLLAESYADLLRANTEMIAQLADCYRLSGADPDGNEDWRLAPYAVIEVRRLRQDSDIELDRIERLNRNLLASAQRYKDFIEMHGFDFDRAKLNAYQNKYPDRDEIFSIEQLHNKERLEAAINSATPKQGEGK